MNIEKIQKLNTSLIEAVKQYDKEYLNFELVPVWSQRDHIVFALVRLISRANRMLEELAEMDM